MDISTEDYGGVVWDVSYSPTTTGSGFVPIGSVYDIKFDNDSDTVDRKFVDATHLSITSNYVDKVSFSTTNSSLTNLQGFAKDYTYASAAKIDGYNNVTVGTGGATQFGTPTSTATGAAGILKLVPRIAAQASHTFYLLGAKITSHKPLLDDNLSGVNVEMQGKLIEGDITFSA